MNGTVETPWWWNPRVVAGEDRGWVTDWLHMDLAQRQELLTALRDAIPKREVRDGIESSEEHPTSKDLGEPHLKAAADILELQELELSIAGEPMDETSRWREIIQKVGEDLAEQRQKLSDRTPTRHSIEEHLFLAEEALRGAKFALGLGQHLARSEEEAVWVESMQSEMAIQVFSLGWQLRALVSKPLESYILPGQKVVEGARMGAAMSSGPSRKTLKILERMDQAITDQLAANKRRNVSEAARKVYRAGYGTSADSNRRLYSRNRK